MMGRTNGISNIAGGSDWLPSTSAIGGNDWLSSTSATGGNDWLTSVSAIGGNDWLSSTLAIGAIDRLSVTAGENIGGLLSITGKNDGWLTTFVPKESFLDWIHGWFQDWFLPYAAVGLVATVLLYIVSLRLSAKWPWLHPVFLPSLALIAAIVIFQIPLEFYEAGGDLLSFWLGPATVALAVPVYKHARLIRQHLAAVCIGVMTGTLSAALVSAVLMLTWTNDAALIVSMAVKSVTTPISMELSRALGGMPELTASFTVLTGLIGSWFGPRLLKRANVRDESAIGVAIGTTAHGIGTGRLMRESEYAGSVSSIGMGLAGIFLSLVTAVAVMLFGIGS